MENTALNKEDFIKLRNETIYALYKNHGLRYTDIANLKVKHIFDNGATIRLLRGKTRTFNVAISKEITKNMQLLSYNREDDETIFYSPSWKNRQLSRTRVQAIISELEGKPVKIFVYGSDLREEPTEPKYHVRELYNKYVVCYDNRPMPGLSMDVEDHAEQIANIMNIERGAC